MNHELDRKLHKCPICETKVKKFEPYGDTNRQNARCPSCGSVERYRLLYLYLKRQTEFLASKRAIRVLEIAPSQASEKIFSDQNIKYTSVDISSPRARVLSDITRLCFGDATFDLVICYHTLEHIPDDLLALAEIHRVTKPGGTAIVQVPIDINRKNTLENPDIPPEQYEQVFGQKDHVRIYGMDFVDRLRNAGFDTTIERYAGQFSRYNRQKYGLKISYPLRNYITSEDIYVCKKFNLFLRSSNP